MRICSRSSNCCNLNFTPSFSIVRVVFNGIFRGAKLACLKETNCPRKNTATFVLYSVAVVAILLLVSTIAAAQSQDTKPLGRELHDQVVRVARDYRLKLAELAAWCENKALANEAAQTKSWSKSRAADKLYITVLSDKIGPSKPAGDSSPAAREWHERFWQLRCEQADELFKLARSAADERRPSLAFDLVLACLHENPDHETARGILGYQRFRDRWQTLYEISKLKAGWVKSERFGWIRQADLSRYEKGERRRGNRWISAEEDARLHADIRSGWDVETEHYTIRTNHSIEAAAALGERLEQLHNVWKRLFIRYYATQSQVMSLFEGKPRGRPIKLPRHSVVYFRDRDDYNESLKRAFPNIEISTGVYAEQTRRAYFFAGSDADDRTLLHEATHQLFHETRPVAENVGQNANFWVVEGIALYMESLRVEDGQFVLGGFDDVRMKAARYRLLSDNFYIPLAELCGYGMKRIQADPRIATLYSQMAGLTNFLVYYDNGRYRDALVAYLYLVYGGNQNPAVLSELTGCSPEELDKQYREFMQKGPDATDRQAD